MRLLVVVALFTAVASASPRPGESSCLTAYGRTVCGYACLAAHGEAGCARTARGACGASSTGVVCWDPPEIVRAHYGVRAPFAECATRDGTTVCGYRCTAHDENVKCADTPDGICLATALGITCWDPPPVAYCAEPIPLPRPECISVDGHVACGYGCLARNGQMACAATPAGRCEIGGGGALVCFDPEGPAMCGLVPCGPDSGERPWCPKPAPKEN